MKFKLFMTVLLTALLSNTAWSGIDEGIEYKKLDPAQPTITKNKIEVVELFWYGCPHCYHFEPHLKKWLKNKPDNVVFRRIPAIFNRTWALHARAYYAAEALDILHKKNKNNETFHDAFFHEIHEKKKHFHKKKDIRLFFERFDVAKDDFYNAFDSFAVNTKVGRAATMSKRYQLDGVPTLVINGKYRTDGPMAGGRKGIIKVLDYLIKKESKK